ncbi:PAS domain-containing protein [Fodinicurvata sp. EGI_FJ10296]|uniref:PAS domain-containing protein n=1 Tax=Fodinicurvata sp. EGI_FJ10296 TaxID=3231908 RepID=UPI003455D1D5
MIVEATDLKESDRQLWFSAVRLAEQASGTFRAALHDTDLQHLFDYWLYLSRNHGAAKSAFDPLAVSPMLGHVQIFEALDDNRIRVRLSGTHANGMIGHDVTGSFLEDYISHDHTAVRYFLYHQVCKRGTPLFYTDSVRVDHRDIFWSRRLLTPLYDDLGVCRYLYSAVKLHTPVNFRSDNELLDIGLAGPDDLTVGQPD